ncbi:MAG: iron-containing alcohol dehydrogenase [Lachnospiraceae bacterium]
MKAIILNSGRGKRLGELTSKHPKCMTQIFSSETIISHQLKLLKNNGIQDVVITTGPFEEEFVHYCESLKLGLNITYVHNPDYDRTNYIYSIYLAREYLTNNRVILIHGDLVFEESVLQDVLQCKDSCLVVSSTTKLPEKDFKAVYKSVGTSVEVSQVGIEFFENAVAAQPFYNLCKEDWNIWKDRIERYCEMGKTSCYAENALNEVSERCHIVAMDIKDRLCDEIDTVEDLDRVKQKFYIYALEKNRKDNAQIVYESKGDLKKIAQILNENQSKRPFVVCGHFFENSSFTMELKKLPFEFVFFSDFTPNPTYSAVIDGVELFEKSQCDFLIAIGGGSTIDVAKSIKYYGNATSDGASMLPLDYVPLSVPLLVVPTTAGSGSEATKYAVIYDRDEKKSITSHALIPNYVILDSDFLIQLPAYQKKSTLLDAFCQAIESYWSIHSTIQSKIYARKAMEEILRYRESYLENHNDASEKMLMASYYSGKAINITQTTAAHAMSYKLTSLYKIPHGHAVAVCLPSVWEYMIKHLDECIDVRGTTYLEHTFGELASIMNCNSPMKAVEAFRKLLIEMEIYSPRIKTSNQLDVLVDSVNETRLNNNPIKLNKEIIRELYTEIL